MWTTGTIKRLCYGIDCRVSSISQRRLGLSEGNLLEQAPVTSLLAAEGQLVPGERPPEKLAGLADVPSLLLCSRMEMSMFDNASLPIVAMKLLASSLQCGWCYTQFLLSCLNFKLIAVGPLSK